MMSRGALLFGDGHLDGRTLWTVTRRKNADIEDDESEGDDVEGEDLAAEDFEIYTDDEEDDLSKDPDFIDSAKKNANRAFVIKSEKYKIIEAVLKSGDFDSYIQGLGASEDGVDEWLGDKEEVVLSDRKVKGVIMGLNSSMEEQFPTKSVVKGCKDPFSKNHVDGLTDEDEVDFEEGFIDDFECLDEDDFQSYISGSDDDLASDPDFAESGTYWLSHVPEERAAQIATHKALKRAEEEQLTYLPLLLLKRDFDTLSILRSFPKATACGPSGLRIQHLLDVAEVPVPTSISSSLKDIVNLLASGKVPSCVSKYLARGSLTALVKDRPEFISIAVGEALRRLVGKCLCLITNAKVAILFSLEWHVLLVLKRSWAHPPLGLFVNPTKCELFGLADLNSFPIKMKRSNVPHLEILGAPIGDLIFCAKIVAQKRAIALMLLNQQSEVGSVDPQVALLLLRQCGGFCKLVHLSRSTPSSLVADALSLYSDDIHQCFTECTSVDTPDNAWQQAQLSLSCSGSWGLNLHLDPSEFQAGIKWWLGIDSSQSANCPYCPSHCLDPLGHHALTCKYRGDVVSRHNRLRDVFLESCRRACIGARVEAGSGLGHDQHRTRPADVLVPDWVLGKPAAFDITVTSSLNPSTCTEASAMAGSAALAAEQWKHHANVAKCSELGWKCVPLAVESYGCWGIEARQHLA
ncbi:hypothetical protein EMCRGX_G032713 [Ephydatia muelleri]